MIILYRVLPLLSAIFISVAFKLQLENPFDYPWWVFIGFIEVVVAILLISYRRIKFFDLLEKIAPTILLLLAFAFSLLLVENNIEKWVIVILSGVAVFLSMELLFFLIYMPPRYPMHGLSRVNIAYVPLIIWYTVYTSIGFITFLHTSAWVHVALMILVSIILFRTTGHPEATKQENKTWILVGLITGLYLGLLGVSLPLSMASQGALSMVLFSVVLRMRRFLYKPIPSKKQIWIEGVIASISFIAIILTSRWL